MNTRRRFLKTSLAISAPLIALGSGYVLRHGVPMVGAEAETEGLPAESGVLPFTPECVDADDVELTPAQTEGPYFTRDSPQRTSLLEEGMPGTPLTVTGYVLSADCHPVAGALLDFWQADDAGQYDNVGYRLRGHQFTDDAGRYTLETIAPGLYPGRTRHIHLKVQAPNARVLSTQLYFPADAARNARDGIYRPELLMDVQDTPTGQIARFDFVVSLG